MTWIDDGTRLAKEHPTCLVCGVNLKNARSSNLNACCKTAIVVLAKSRIDGEDTHTAFMRQVRLRKSHRFKGEI